MSQRYTTDWLDLVSVK
ncbi:MAG: hypothetical protein Q7U38_12205 [Methylobacter sp.]|nr:hypothetical protein [Methylobacter sp.]MDP2429768.1 hypothetical protein [Methylobacter sp.]MDP3056570.1 hypothetical protein [Methylobacter sp.]MDP3364176.1 hypothetical protein [Methylobacter sp.]MDZ4217966.1 hypothetical protein [Methylobacter sp.]